LWGAGRGATITLQGAQSNTSNPAVIQVTGNTCSVKYLTIQGIASPLGGPPSASASGYGWALLFTEGATDCLAYEVAVEKTWHGIGVAPGNDKVPRSIQVESVRLTTRKARRTIRRKGYIAFTRRNRRAVTLT
jgi:hypothetical protein